LVEIYDILYASNLEFVALNCNLDAVPKTPATIK